MYVWVWKWVPRASATDSPGDWVQTLVWVPVYR